MAQIRELTGLRGIAAYSVLVAHTLNFVGVDRPELTVLAYFGMSLFFVLSGFVISYNYGPSFGTEPVAVAARRFLIARFARLYPLYFVGLVLSIGFEPSRIAVDNPLVGLACLTLTQTWFNVHGATGDMIGGSWSISTEFFLYLAFIPLAGPLLRARQPLRWLIALCAVAPIVIVIISNVVPNTSFELPKISAPLRYWFLYFSPFVRAFEFFVGVLAARILIDYRTDVAIRSGHAVWMIALCICWCLFVIFVGSYVRTNVVVRLLPNFVFAPAIAGALVFISSGKTFWSRLASSRLAIGAGEISYSVYLLQGLVFVALSRSFAESSSDTSIFLRAVYAIAITTALGYGTYYLFESPMRAWIRNLPRRRLNPVGSVTINSASELRE